MIKFTQRSFQISVLKSRSSTPKNVNPTPALLEYYSLSDLHNGASQVQSMTVHCTLQSLFISHSFESDNITTARICRVPSALAMLAIILSPGTREMQKEVKRQTE
jgi:hypothetical protein